VRTPLGDLFRYPEAILQWSYLPQEFRASTAVVPADVKAWLDKRLASKNEITTVVIFESVAASRVE
jgi:hypothetical protein